MDGFFKVAESGGTYVTGIFYNPTTNTVRRELLRDYDYADGSRDNDELYYMPINEEARTLWLHSMGRILVGDVVEVYKGRKVPVGTVGRVKDIKPFKDRYGRTVADYVYFEDGQRTNIENCRLKED